MQGNDDALPVGQRARALEQPARMLDVHRPRRRRTPLRRAAGTPRAIRRSCRLPSWTARSRSRGRASSSGARPSGIGASARSSRYSTAVAPAGTRETRRLASSRSRGASEATKAGIGRALVIKIKNPRAHPGRGFRLSSLWIAPPERVGRADAALPGCLPPPPVSGGATRDHRGGIILPGRAPVKALPALGWLSVPGLRVVVAARPFPLRNSSGNTGPLEAPRLRLRI